MGMVFEYLVYLVAGLGSGAIAGMAGLSTAVVITPLLVSLAGWKSFDAVTVALAADILASLMSANTYRRHGNFDLRRGCALAICAFVGTVFGCYSGFLFSQSQPDGLGYISMLTTLCLAVKFLFKPAVSGASASDGHAVSTRRLVAGCVLAVPIGWVCGFTGSGGGALMLMVLTIVIGYDLKSAVGTSAIVMTVVAAVGAVGHFALGAQVFPIPMLVVVATCPVGAVLAARFANGCEIHRLNRVVGITLLVLGVVTLGIKLFL